jgi:methionine sulfoxide reductase catalytic subunit
MSNATVGRLMDLLFDHYAPRAEYREQDISPYFWPNGLVPTSNDWKALKDATGASTASRYPGWSSTRSSCRSMTLRRWPSRIRSRCTTASRAGRGSGNGAGCRFTELIELVRPRPEAQWASFRSFGEGGEGGEGCEYYDSHSMRDLRHPQSLLAYEMNGEPLPVLHGSPLRLRVENQLGFKHFKWIREIEFVHDFRDYGAGQGGYNEDHELYG